MCKSLDDQWISIFSLQKKTKFQSKSKTTQSQFLWFFVSISIIDCSGDGQKSWEWMRFSPKNICYRIFGSLCTSAKIGE